MMLRERIREMWRRQGPRGGAERLLWAVLAPAEWAHRLGVSLRNWAYDRNWLPSSPAPIPGLVVGNLTVGGTGKTPVTAWLARHLKERDARPAVVLRGYGGDEVEVHRRINPSVPVFAAADRLAALDAARRAGCAVAVLDDAFQHRRIRAGTQIVLVAAEEWTDRPRLLPRGPWREEPQALRRATLTVVTRKTATVERAEEVERALAERVPGIPCARVHLGLAGVARYQTSGELGEVRPLSGFRCALAVAGVARPEALLDQLRSGGACVEGFRAFPDHHRYSAPEVDEIRDQGASGPIVMTLKDAVKLGGALEDLEVYVAIQEVLWESGRETVEGLMGKLVTTFDAEREGR